MIRTAPAIVALLLVASPAPAADPPAERARANVEALLEQLDTGDWILQADAIAKLARREPRLAATTLGPIAADTQRPPWLRGEALKGLAAVDRTAAVKLARPMLDDRAEDLLVAATDVLGRRGESRDVEPLARLADDPRNAVRRAALLALAHRAPKRAWRLVDRAMADDAPAADATHAAEALAVLGDARARKRLETMLADPRAGVRIAAIDANAGFADRRSAEALFDVVARTPVGDDGVHAAAARALATGYGDRVNSLLIDRLGATDAASRRAALQLIAARPTEALCDVLAERLADLADRDPDAAAAALGVLGATDAKRYESTFTAMLNHRTPTVQRAAVARVAVMDGDDAYRHLTPVMQRASDSVKDALLAAVEQRHDAPKQGLAKFLSPALVSRNADLRRRAMRLLTARIKPDDFGDALAALDPWLAGTDTEARDEAAKLLLDAAPRDRRHEVVAALGYIAEWKVIGSFPNDKQNGGLAAVYPPQRRIDFDAEYDGAEGQKARWSAWRVDRVDGRVELHRIMPVPVHYRVAYGYAELKLDRAMPATFTIDCDEAFTLFLNGKPVCESGRRGVVRRTVPLKQGVNRVLIKVANLRDWWYYSVRLTDADGKRVLVPPPPSAEPKD